MLVPAIQTIVVYSLTGSKKIPEKYFGVSSIKKLALTRCRVSAEEFSDILKVPRELREFEFFSARLRSFVESRELGRAIAPLKGSLENLCIRNASYSWDVIVGSPKEFKRLRRLEYWPKIIDEPRTWALPESLEEIVVNVIHIEQLERILELVMDESMRALKRTEIISSYELFRLVRSDQMLCREGMNLVFTFLMPDREWK
jgi:hypothetical protein